MKALYWVSLEIGIDAVSEEDAIKKVKKILDGERSDFNAVVSGAYKDDHIESLRSLREKNLEW